MTREEEVMKAARVYANGIAQHLPNKKYCEEDFIAGAKWADSTMIDKACEWLKDYAYMFVSETTGDLYEDDLINDFRKDMKGE